MVKRRIIMLGFLLETTANAITPGSTSPVESVLPLTYPELEKTTHQLERLFLDYSKPGNQYGVWTGFATDKNGNAPIPAIVGKNLFFELRDNNPNVTEHIQNKLVLDYGNSWAWAMVWMLVMDAQFREEQVLAYCLSKKPSHEVQSDMALYAKDVNYLLGLFNNATYVDDSDSKIAAQNIYSAAAKHIGQYLGVWCQSQNINLYDIFDFERRLNGGGLPFDTLWSKI